MDLWIRSQNKRLLIKSNALCLSEEKNAIFTKPDFINTIDLVIGVYATEERALEVLDEIENYIDEIASGHLDRRYLEVYQMPKE